MVRYYGYYSNVKLGRRKKQNQDGWIPCILQPEGSTKKYRKNWARLIQKIYPVEFPEWNHIQPGSMRLIPSRARGVLEK